MKHFILTAAGVLYAWWMIELQAWGALLPLAILVLMNVPWVRRKLMKDDTEGER